MNKDYAKHFLMKAEDVMACTIDLVHYFEPGARLSCREIGDGNINYVFVVTDEDTGRSIVVKQADKFVRSSGRPLNLNHNKIEADVLSIEGACAPSMVPKIYYYDEVMCALYMEDISAYKNLRKEMVQGKIFPKLAEDISTFMADTLLPSTDLVLDRATKKERVKNSQMLSFVISLKIWFLPNRITITKSEISLLPEMRNLLKNISTKMRT